MDTTYELLRDYEAPTGKICKGVRKSEGEWRERFPGLNQGDCAVKKDWFRAVTTQKCCIVLQLEANDPGDFSLVDAVNRALRTSKELPYYTLMTLEDFEKQRRGTESRGPG
jgi:hypothetical protein